VNDRRRPLNLVVALAVALGFLIATAAPATACAEPILNRQGKVIGCASGGTEGQPGTDDGNGNSGGTGQGVSWSPPSGWERVEYRLPAYEDDGTPCIRIVFEWMPRERAAGFRTTAAYSWFWWYDRLTADGSTMEVCTAEPGAPAIDPAMVQQMITSQLPLPAPSIEPGRAITGLRSYLDVGAPTTFSDRIDGDVLPVRVEISGTAQYRVDWGDGTVLTYPSSGGPYPDGDITHVYTDAGDYTVTVTPLWRVRWQGAGFDLTFDAELVSSTVDLPVEEVRAVRTR
jgi:hypothetical protein